MASRVFRTLDRSLRGSIALVALAWALPALAAAASITVNSESDTIANDGRCSLREAISAANGDAASGGAAGECAAGSGADTISVPAGVYTLSIAGPGEDANSSGDLDVSSDLAIAGAGARRTTVRGDGTDRVVDVVTATTVSIAGLTVTGGRLPDTAAPAATVGAAGSSGNPAGAGVPALGTPGAAGASGGGIRSAGTLTVTDSIVTDNRAGRGATGGQAFGGVGGAGSGGAGGASGGTALGGVGGAGGAGGGIFSSGTLTLTGASVTDNVGGAGADGGQGFGGFGGAGSGNAAGGSGASALGGAAGAGGRGGVGASGPLTLRDATIADNRSGTGGVGGQGFGGFGGAGAGVGTGGSGGAGFGGTGGAGGAGGGVSAGAADIGRTTLASNGSGKGGVGGQGFGGSGGGGKPTFNSAGGSGGNGFGGGGGDGGADGAGIFTSATALVNSTVHANRTGAGSAGGAGFGGFGGSGQGSGNGGAGGAGFGSFGGAGGANGGVGGTGALAVTHATVTANASDTGSSPGGTGSGGTGGVGGGGGSAGAGGAGSAGAAGTAGGGAAIASSTSTLTDTIATDNAPSNCAGTVNDGGHNLRSDGSCPGTLTADAGLAALQDNGGPTETQALKPGSPAIDLVPAAGASCAPTDQRGVPRPQGTACDAGAYEVAPPTATTGPATDLTATAATLTGTTNPNARGTSYHFEFGPTTTYDSRTSDQDAGQGLADVAAGAPLSGLAPTTTYHYRLVATSSDGTTAGADQTFTTPAPPTIPPEPPDTIRPVLTAVSLTNRTFAVSSGSTAVAAKAKRGTKFAYKLSEPATVKISLERATTGRRKGSKCVKATKKLAKAKKCTLYVAAGALTRASVAGRNTVPFTGRVGSHALSVASYRATLVATDAAKNKSKSATVKFKVVKR